MKLNKYILTVAMSLGALGLSLTSCEDQPDKFEPTEGTPVVKYVRMASVESADSLIESAYMESVICLVGDNLKSINEIYFNDQKAVINTSYLTDHTFIVAVPPSIPEEVTNKIYMVNHAGVRTEYDFKVLVPKPVISSMSNEWAKPGDIVTVYGDFFIDDPNVPLFVTFPGNVKATEISDITKTSFKVKVPDGATMEGSVSVTSIYGTGQSVLHYHETRGMILDWDGVNGLAMGYGWRDGSKVLKTDAVDGIEPLDGNFILFDKEEMTNAEWPDEDNVSFNYWPDNLNGYPDITTMLGRDFDALNWSDYSLKFEVCIPSSAPWTGVAMQWIFTSYDDVNMENSANANNNYIGSDDTPRALWTPYSTTGSYDTGGNWTTVTIPLSNFVFSRYAGTPGKSITPQSFAGLTAIMYAGSQAQKMSTRVYIAIDNIRIVPAK